MDILDDSRLTIEKHVRPPDDHIGDASSFKAECNSLPDLLEH
jgi:hypothetical protein